MATYQVSAVFRKGIEYYAIDAESEQDARGRAERAFAPNLEFYYIDAVSPLDGYIPRDDPSPTPQVEGTGCPFCHAHTNILTLTAIDGATEVCALEAPGHLHWCSCGGVWIKDDDGIRMIGSNHPGDQRWFISKYNPSPTPAETPKGMRRFVVEVDVNGIGHHHYVEAGDWDDAQTKTERAYKGQSRGPVVIEITRLTDLPRKS